MTLYLCATSACGRWHAVQPGGTRTICGLSFRDGILASTAWGDAPLSSCPWCNMHKKRAYAQGIALSARWVLVPP